MAAFTTFLTGVLVGGAAKWLYDTQQDDNTTIKQEVANMSEQSAEKVRDVSNSMQAKADQAQAHIEEAQEQVAATAQNVSNTVKAQVEQASDAVTISKSDVAIENYDALTVDEAKAKLGGLTNEQLRKLAMYEKANQNRTTMLQELERSIVDLPITNYDKLIVDEVASGLAALSVEEIQTIKAYETAHANRVTLLRQIDKELEERD